MFQSLVQLAQWLAANHRAVAQTSQMIYVGTRVCQETYKRLSPENQRVVDDIIRRGVEQALKVGLTLALGEVGLQVAAAVADPVVAEQVKKVVERGVEIGVDKALEDYHRNQG